MVSYPSLSDVSQHFIYIYNGLILYVPVEFILYLRMPVKLTVTEKLKSN